MPLQLRLVLPTPAVARAALQQPNGPAVLRDQLASLSLAPQGSALVLGIAHVPCQTETYWALRPLHPPAAIVRSNRQPVCPSHPQGSNPVLGIVHVPCQAKTYWALQGRGAYCRSAEGQKRLQAAEFGLTDPGLVVVGSASHGSPLMQVRFESILNAFRYI